MTTYVLGGNVLRDQRILLTQVQDNVQKLQEQLGQLQIDSTIQTASTKILTSQQQRSTNTAITLFASKKIVKAPLSPNPVLDDLIKQLLSTTSPQHVSDVFNAFVSAGSDFQKEIQDHLYRVACSKWLVSTPMVRDLATNPKTQHWPVSQALKYNHFQEIFALKKLALNSPIRIWTPIEKTCLEKLCQNPYYAQKPLEFLLHDLNRATKNNLSLFHLLCELGSQGVERAIARHSYRADHNTILGATEFTTPLILIINLSDRPSACLLFTLDFFSSLSELNIKNHSPRQLRIQDGCFVLNALELRFSHIQVGIIEANLFSKERGHQDSKQLSEMCGLEMVLLNSLRQLEKGEVDPNDFIKELKTTWIAQADQLNFTTMFKSLLDDRLTFLLNSENLPIHSLVALYCFAEETYLPVLTAKLQAPFATTFINLHTSLIKTLFTGFEHKTVEWLLDQFQALDDSFEKLNRIKCDPKIMNHAFDQALTVYLKKFQPFDDHDVDSLMDAAQKYEWTQTLILIQNTSKVHFKEEPQDPSVQKLEQLHQSLKTTIQDRQLSLPMQILKLREIMTEVGALLLSPDTQKRFKADVDWSKELTENYAPFLLQLRVWYTYHSNSSSKKVMLDSFLNLIAHQIIDFFKNFYKGEESFSSDKLRQFFSLKLLLAINTFNDTHPIKELFIQASLKDIWDSLYKLTQESSQ